MLIGLTQLPDKLVFRLSAFISCTANWCLSHGCSGQLTVESGQLWYPLRGLFEIITIIIITNYSENRNICGLYI